MDNYVLYSIYFALFSKLLALVLLCWKVIPKQFLEYKIGGLLSGIRLRLFLTTASIVAIDIIPGAYLLCRLSGCDTPFFYFLASLTSSAAYLTITYSLVSIYENYKK